MLRGVRRSFLLITQHASRHRCARLNISNASDKLGGKLGGTVLKVGGTVRRFSFGRRRRQRRAVELVEVVSRDRDNRCRSKRGIARCGGERHRREDGLVAEVPHEHAVVALGPLVQRGVVPRLSRGLPAATLC